MTENEFDSPVVVDNSQIADYLNFFLNIKPSPGYAVFLNGVWGSGKTWFIRKFQADHPEFKYLYVTLYGVKSITQIEDQFFQQLHPWLSSKPFNIGAKLFKGVLKGALKIDLNDDGNDDLEVNTPTIPSEDLKKVLSEAEGRVLIFDDLERCPIAEEVLGYINHFVEHQEQRVIIIGHEEELLQFPDFLKKKEKLIGRSFTLHAEIESAFGKFVDLIDNEQTKSILRDNLDLILGIYEKSGSRNLRTLRYSILEYGRFFSNLPSHAREQKEFQSQCIRSFFVFCIELRSGRITSKAINGLGAKFNAYRLNQAMGQAPNIDNKSEVAAFEKYFGSYSDSITPNEMSLYYFFEYGFIPDEILTEAIDTNQYFLIDRTPSWVRLWYALNLKEEEFASLCTEVFSQFEQLKFTNPGEIRHIFGMMLSYSKKGMLSNSYDQALELCKEVVGQLIKENKIELVERKAGRDPDFGDVYSGLQFSFYDEKDFQELSKSLDDYQQHRTEMALSEIAKTIPDLIKSDWREVGILLTSSDSSHPYACRVPILKEVSAELFVKSLIEMDPAHTAKLHFGNALKERYNFIGTYKELIEELPWLKLVKDEILKVGPALAQPTKYQMECVLERFISPTIEKLEQIPKRPVVDVGL